MKPHGHYAPACLGNGEPGESGFFDRIGVHCAERMDHPRTDDLNAGRPFDVADVAMGRCGVGDPVEVEHCIEVTAE